MKRLARCAALALLSLSVAACGGNADLCVNRGTQRTWRGSVAYEGELSSPSPLTIAGANDAEVTVDDYDPFESGTCSQGGIEFTLTTQDCMLWAAVGGQEHDTGRGSSGDFLSASATIEGGQSCDASLTGHTIHLAPTSGVLSLLPGSASLTLAGAVEAWDGQAAEGFVSWTFTGP